MNKLLLTLFCFFTIAGNVYSQVAPKEGSSLNYRLIGFSPFVTRQPGNYEIQIASGNYLSEDEFDRNIIKTIACKTNRSIIEVPSFGSSYTWRTVAGKIKGELHHFETQYSPKVDTANVRLRILEHAAKYNNAYVCLDGTTVLYDMKGQPVWFFPEKLKGLDKNVRDLKLTSEGTITFLANDNGYEINYDGDILWKTPENAKTGNNVVEHYHHEFTRLSNGHYMVLGNEGADGSFYNRGNVKKDASCRNNDLKMPFGTVVEFDKSGNVVWLWRSLKYIGESDLADYKPKIGMGVDDLHSNAFFFDEKEKVVYLSFKGISRIIKIKYPEGTVLNTFGEIYKPGTIEPKGNGLFCGQHACKYSQIGCLFLFNNNGCTPGGLPKIKQFREMNDGNNSLEKLWEYQCSVEGNDKKEFVSGGNVSELPDRSLFVCMGGSYSKVFIVGMDKKVSWSAIAEKWDADQKQWRSVAQYRASIIYDSKLLERFVWSAEERSDVRLAVERTAGK